MVVSFLIWETCGGKAVLKALTGKATLSHGQKNEGTSSSELWEHNVESLALNVMGQDQSGRKITLFLKDRELARVPLSCHIALDTLCQEMHEAW